MCSNCEKRANCGRDKPVAITKETGCADCGPIESGSCLSASRVLFQGSALAVYKRRKLGRPVTATSAQACENTSCRKSNIVYKRRKLKKNLVYRRRKLQAHPVTSFVDRISTKMGPNVKSMVACCTVNNLANLATEKNKGVVELRETEAVGSCSMSMIINEPFSTNSKTMVDCLVEVHDFEGKDKMNRTVEMCSMGDSCSSSMLNVDIDPASLEIELDDSGECSSSGDLRGEMEDELSGKDLCISILRSHGLISCCRQNTVEDAPCATSVSGSRSCDVCSQSETTGNLLICDQCEAAFHLSCCSPPVKKVPLDEWYCQSCFKKKRIILKETKEKRPPIIKSEASAKVSVSEGGPGSIAFMLTDTRPYTTGVRIGKDFQAAVPDWSGPVARVTDAVAEPMELDLIGTFNLPETRSSKRRKFSTIGNWLQCRQVVYGIGDDRDGAICGKWRRAPLFEVQTDDWECFRCILWDPSHADCAAPQELETDEVLKQLKYVEMLKPRLNARKRKMTAGRVNGCRGTVADKRKCTTESVKVERRSE